MIPSIVVSTALNVLLLLMVSYVLSRGGFTSDLDLDESQNSLAWLLVWIILIEAGYNCTVLVVNMLQSLGPIYVYKDWLHHPAFSALFVSKHFILFFINRRK